MHNRRMRLAHKYSPSSIIGCDETPCWFEPAASTTVEARGAKSVTIKTTGHDKMRCTVMLTGKADGTKLKPFVVLNRKRRRQNLEENHTDLVFSYGKSFWMDQAKTEVFLDSVIGKFSFTRRLLVWEAFSCHISPQTKLKLANMKIDSSVIPGGTTKYLQPADVCWNRPFKANMTRCYDDWIASENFELTAAGNLKAPSLDLVASWISKSWNEISPELIKKSFKCCGITAAADGSEDNEITCLKEGGPCYSEETVAQLEVETGQLNREAHLPLDEQLEDLFNGENEEDVQELEANTVVIDMDESMEEEPDDAEDWNSDWSEEMYCKSKMN